MEQVAHSISVKNVGSVLGVVALHNVSATGYSAMEALTEYLDYVDSDAAIFQIETDQGSTVKGWMVKPGTIAGTLGDALQLNAAQALGVDPANLQQILEVDLGPYSVFYVVEGEPVAVRPITASVADVSFSQTSSGGVQVNKVVAECGEGRVDRLAVWLSTKMPGRSVLVVVFDEGTLRQVLPGDLTPVANTSGEIQNLGVDLGDGFVNNLRVFAAVSGVKGRAVEAIVRHNCA